MVDKPLAAIHIRSEPSHRLRATSVSPFTFSKKNRQINNLIASIKALKPCLLSINYGL